MDRGKYYLADIYKSTIDNEEGGEYKLCKIAEISYGSSNEPFYIRQLSSEISLPVRSDSDAEELERIANSYHEVIFKEDWDFSLGSSEIENYNEVFRPAFEVFTQEAFNDCYPVIREKNLIKRNGQEAFNMNYKYKALFKPININKSSITSYRTFPVVFDKVLIECELDDRGNKGLRGPYDFVDNSPEEKIVRYQLRSEDDLLANTVIPIKDFGGEDKKPIYVTSDLVPLKKGELFSIGGMRANEEELNKLKEEINKCNNKDIEDDELIDSIRYENLHGNLWDPMDPKAPELIRSSICNLIQEARPKDIYTKNVIENIAICVTQGFLTVFSGAPGCGKTSICNIFADAIGLNKIANYAEPKDKRSEAGRYISVSVEQGWTSKNDFIGYYNSLYEKMVQSNHEVFNMLNQLDKESQNNNVDYPCLILLDEANLSSIEYYWSDFMKIGDKFFDESLKNTDFFSKSKPSYIATIEGGKRYHFSENLRFMATINNDYSTSPLSPRLIDRAWVITLPNASTDVMPKMNDGSLDSLNNSEVKIITWNMLRKAFDFNSADSIDKAWNEAPEVRGIYKEVVKMAEKLKISVSLRAARMIKRYWATAQKIFEDEDNEPKEICALDYAVAQKILPCIEGNGDEYIQSLDELRTYCKEKTLKKCEKLLDKIIKEGNRVGRYYKFFH